jgi:MFS family permease
MIGLCGRMLNDGIIILMTKYWRTLGLEFFLVGAVLDGLLGSFATKMAATNAYVADCTTPERRAISFAYIHSCFFLGTAVGPVIGGLVINYSNSVITLFYGAFVVHIFFALFILFFVPESVTPELMAQAKQNHNARRFSADGIPYSPRHWRYWTNIFNIFQPLEIFWPRGRGSSFKLKKRNLLVLVVVDGILLLTMGAFAVIILYPVYMFNWGDLEVRPFVTISNFRADIICQLSDQYELLYSL